MQGLGATAPKQRDMGDIGPQEPLFDCTEFVAETLLPTVSGKYRLRGYRHTVSHHHPSLNTVLEVYLSSSLIAQCNSSAT